MAIQIEQIERYTAHPGDVLLFHVSGRMTETEVEHMVEALHATFPHNKILLLDHGTKVRVLNPVEAQALEFHDRTPPIEPNGN